MSNTTVNEAGSTNSTTATSAISPNYNEFENACVAAIEDYDVQIAAYTAEMTDLIEQKTEVREAKGEVDSLASRTPDGEGEAAYIQLTQEEGEALIESLEEAGFDTTELEDGTYFYGVDQNDDGETEWVYKLPPSWLEAASQNLDDQMTELNSQSELKMIGFQSIVDARKQTMLMLSNMVNNNSQTMLEIIRNMKG